LPREQNSLTTFESSLDILSYTAINEAVLILVQTLVSTNDAVDVLSIRTGWFTALLGSMGEMVYKELVYLLF